MFKCYFTKKPLFFFSFIYYFWLCWVFTAVRGLPLIAVGGLFIAMASPVAGHEL